MSCVLWLFRSHFPQSILTQILIKLFFHVSGGVHVSASRGSPPGASSVGGGGASGLGGGGLNCGQGSPGAATGSGGAGGVSCVGGGDGNGGTGGEATDWRGVHSIAALRRRASDASQQYSPQPPPPPGPPQYAHDLEYSSVYWTTLTALEIN